MPPRARAAPDDPIALEQQRLQEMEKRHRQTMLLQGRLEDLLEEESMMARMSLKDIEARWMRFLRDKKQKELVEEIEVLRNTFEKTLDRKSAVLSMMGMDLDEAEMQYRLALRTHLGNVDSLLDLQRRRMATLEAQFESDLMEMRSDFELERAHIMRHHELELSDLRLIVSNMTAEAEAKDRGLQEEISESHETASEKMEEEKKQMQSDLTKQNDKLRNELDSRFKDFMTNAQANMKDYMDKTKEDEDTAEKIADQMRKIAKLQESITTWKSNLSNNIQECEQRNRDMKAEKEATARHFKELKRKMQLWRKGQERRLTELVTNAKEAKKKLESHVSTAEQLLRLVELCRPLETERERVLTFDCDIAVDEVTHEVQQLAQTRGTLQAAQEGNAAAMASLYGMAGADAMSDNPSEEWKLLQRFWVKFNKVQLDNAAIAQEKFHMEQENKKLRQLLKQYLDGVSVNNDVMSARNNLLQAAHTGTAIDRVGEKVHARSGFVPVTEGNKLVTEVSRQRTF